MTRNERDPDTNLSEFFPATAKKASRAENIVGVLEEGIVRGYWKPGDRINDQELAERLGVSRLTVREALSKLVERKLLEKRHWKGYTVRVLTWEEIDSLIDVRITLEELAMRKAVGRASSQMIEELTAAVEESRKAVAEGDDARFFRADFLFHEILYNRSENVWIHDILGDLHLLISLIRHISQAEHMETVARRSIEEHEKILDALGAGKLELALESLRVHLDNHRERVRKEYSQYRPHV